MLAIKTPLLSVAENIEGINQSGPLYRAHRVPAKRLHILFIRKGNCHLSKWSSKLTELFANQRAWKQEYGRESNWKWTIQPYDCGNSINRISSNRFW